jgi:predicted outer membrane repeat protein
MVCCDAGGAVSSTLANSGFTLRNSVLEGNRGAFGGSLYFGADHIGIVISGNVVKASAANYGGAIYFDQFSSGVSLEENALIGNVAKEDGGAIYTLASDLSMLNCQVLGNRASSGGGVYYPSDFLTDHVNITSCLFDGNSASGLYGGVYVELASSVSIDSSNFTGNKASFGSALCVQESGSVTVESCSFVENMANSSAGALFLDSNYAIIITESLFDGNTVGTGSGSAVWLSSNSEVTIRGNRFVRNRAINGGGAVYWLVSSDMSVPLGLESTQSDAMSGNYYEKNQAMYGNNVSTNSYAMTLSDGNNYEVTDYDSSVPPVVVNMVDYYNQIVRVESAGVAVTSVLSTATCFQSTGYVTGGFIAQIQAGVFNFSALNVYCDPGYSMSVNVTSPYYDVKSTYFTLSFRSCVRGEYYEDSVCKPCEVGTYSLTDPSTKELSELSNSAVCKPCPSGAKDCSGDTIELKKGYWRISDNTTTLLACPYGELACRGGPGSGDALCGDGYEGE